MLSGGVSKRRLLVTLNGSLMALLLLPVNELRRINRDKATSGALSGSLDYDNGINWRQDCHKILTEHSLDVERP